MIVSSVETESAAGRAGLKAGDIVVALDGAPIAGADDLVRALTGDKIGRNVTLDVLRVTERLSIAWCRKNASRDNFSPPRRVAPGYRFARLGLRAA